MCKVFPPFLFEIVVCDAQKHKYCIYRVFIGLTILHRAACSLTVWHTACCTVHYMVELLEAVAMQ